MRGWGREDHEQFKVVQYMALQYPHVLFIHVPNESKRSALGHKKLKALGVKSGVSDLLFFHAIVPYHGLAIELKAPPDKNLKKRAGKLTDSQTLFLEALKVRGWKTVCCWGFLEAKKEIDLYLKHEPNSPTKCSKLLYPPLTLPK